MGVDNEIKSYCVDYVRILAVYVILLGIDSTIQATLQAYKLTKAIMVSGLTKVFLNAFLDWILIFGKFGMPVLGVKGAALATSISNIVAIIFIIIYFFNTKEINLKLTPKEVINFNWKSYSKIVSLGIPTGIETFIWHISNLIMVRYLNSLNVMAVGIYTLVYIIEIIVYRFYYGFSKSVLAVVGYKVGDKKFKEAKKIVASALKCDIAFVTAVSILFICLAKPILGLFTKDTVMIDSSVVYLCIVAVCIFPKSFNSILGAGIRGVLLKNSN